MATKNASGNSARLLTTLLLAALLIAASVAGTLFLQDRLPLTVATADTTKTPRPAVMPDPLFTSLEPFTVSLRDDNGSRALYVGITLRVEDDESRKLLSTYMPEVRDRVLATLTKQSPAHIQAPEGRERLAAQLLHELTKPYQPHPVGPQISRVLFTAYVVQ